MQPSTLPHIIYQPNTISQYQHPQYHNIAHFIPVVTNQHPQIPMAPQPRQIIQDNDESYEAVLKQYSNLYDRYIQQKNTKDQLNARLNLIENSKHINKNHQPSPTKKTKININTNFLSHILQSKYSLSISDIINQRKQNSFLKIQTLFSTRVRM